MGQGNASYWEDRAERLLEAREAMTAEQQQILADALQAAQREIEAGIEKFCRRYAKNNKVTYAQAQKALSLKELAQFRGNLPAFRKLAKAHIGEFRLEVDNLSAKAQVTRYQALKAEIDAALQRAYLQMEKGIEAGSLAVYDDQYHRSLFAMDRYTGFRHQYVGIDRDGIKAVMQYPFNGLDYSTRIWRQRDDLSYKLQSTLNTMLITGEPPDKYAEEFARIFKAKEQEAHRLLYTENAYAAEQAKLQAYRDTGVEEYEILATLDTKTSAICREQDGKRYPIGEEKPGINFPPFHPWCRTVTIPAVKGFSSRGMTRAARDPQGEVYYVPAKMTFTEWKKAFVDGMKGGLTIAAEGATIETEKPTVYKTFETGDAVNDFFYFDREERGLLAKKKSEYSQWFKSLSEDERSWILDYTAGGYGDINDYLRKRGSWEYINADKVETATKYLDSAISRFDLQDNIIVQRGVMEDILDRLISQYGDNSTQWIGQVFHDSGYVSTTALRGNPVATTKPVIFEISVPAGRGRGAYVNELSGFTDAEYEFLLKRDGDYIITDVVEEADSGKLIVKVVMKVES